MAAAILDGDALGAAVVAITGASRALAEVAAADPDALRAAAGGALSAIHLATPDEDLPQA